MHGDSSVGTPEARPPLPAVTSHGVRVVLLPQGAPASTSWAIRLGSLPDPGPLLGWVSLQIVDARGEIAFGLDDDHRGRGYAAAAVRALSAWALDPAGAGLAALLWRAEVGNWPARRVVWSCGFLVEGRVRGLLSDPTGRRDGWIGALLPGEELAPLLAWLEPAVIAHGDLLLRPHGPEDADRIVSALQDPLSHRYLDRLPNPYTRADAETFLLFAAEEHAGSAGLHWAITGYEQPDLLLGQISLMGLQSGLSTSAEIGYWMHPDARRQGHCRAAVRAVARHALLPAEEGGLGLDRVFLRAAESNTGSVRVALGAGFVEVGRDRAAQRCPDGTTEDQLRFDLVAAELDSLWAHPSALR